MNILNIVTSPRKEKSASTAIVNAFLSEYREHVRDVTVDRLDIWQERLPEFDAEAINAKYKGACRRTHLGWPRGRHDRGGKETSGGVGEAILIVAQHLNAPQCKGSERRMEGKARFIFPVVITAIIAFVVSGR